MPSSDNALSLPLAGSSAGYSGRTERESLLGSASLRNHTNEPTPRKQPVRKILQVIVKNPPSSDGMAEQGDSSYMTTEQGASFASANSEAELVDGLLKALQSSDKKRFFAVGQIGFGVLSLISSIKKLILPKTPGELHETSMATAFIHSGNISGDPDDEARKALTQLLVLRDDSLNERQVHEIVNYGIIPPSYEFPAGIIAITGSTLEKDKATPHHLKQWIVPGIEAVAMPCILVVTNMAYEESQNFFKYLFSEQCEDFIDKIPLHIPKAIGLSIIAQTVMECVKSFLDKACHYGMRSAIGTADPLRKEIPRDIIGMFGSIVSKFIVASSGGVAEMMPHSLLGESAKLMNAASFPIVECLGLFYHMVRRKRSGTPPEPEDSRYTPPEGVPPQSGIGVQSRNTGDAERPDTTVQSEDTSGAERLDTAAQSKDTGDAGRPIIGVELKKTNNPEQPISLMIKLRDA